MSKVRVFSAVIKRELLLKGKPQRWLAEKIGVNFSTFRVHLQRNEFYEEEARKICGILNLGSAERPADKYSYDPISGTPEWQQPKADTILSLFHAMDRRAKKIHDFCGPVKTSFLNVMGKMGPRDISVVFSGTVTPLEMERTKEGVEFRRKIATSIGENAVFIYIRPTAERIEKYLSHFDIRNIIPFVQQEKEFETFQHDLIDHIEQGDLGSAAKERVESKTFQIHVDECPFFVPGICFNLIRAFDRAGKSMSRLSVRLPGQTAFLCMDHDATASRMVSTARAIIKQFGLGAARKQQGNDKHSVDDDRIENVLKSLRDYHLKPDDQFFNTSQTPDYVM